MKTMQSFLVCFYFLDRCYFTYYEDWMGMICSEMNPELWADGRGRAAVPSAYEDWKELTASIDVTEDNLMQVMLQYWALFPSGYGMEPAKAEQMLRKHLTHEHIQEALAYADEMYEKYHYDD